MSAEQHCTCTEPAPSTSWVADVVLPLSRDEACSAPADRLSPAHRGRATEHTEDEHHGPGQAQYDTEDPESTWQQRAEVAEQRAELAEQRVEAMGRALVSRATIDQAKGVIMGVFGLGPDDAFDVLVWVSQNANVKLATVAVRFLDAARALDLSHGAREQLTALLAELAGSGATSSSENDHRRPVDDPPV